MERRRDWLPPIKGTQRAQVGMLQIGWTDWRRCRLHSWPGKIGPEVLIGSTIGFCTFVGGNLVTWKSKKQNVVARSSAEAEYRDMASNASKLVWIKQLLTDFGIKIQAPMKMYCDNQAARHIASNPLFQERTEHI